ncbi:anti-sigma factor domain-containing protein [Streptomyces sp. NPDC057199]|uniref:anti-sigma factor n=1 Tax=Streptomyces sp. NPDC057199 TaxID=3346047 RepID=UPI0036362AC9
MTTADLHTLTGAYALHALTHDEREEFRRHLAACEPCTQEAAELSATATRLALATSLTPRPALRAQVLHQITTVRQDTPRRPLLPKTARTARRGRLLSRWALAASLAAAAALGTTAAWQHQRAEDALQQARQSQQQTDRIAAVLAAPDAKTRATTLPGGATGTLTVSDHQDKAVLAVTAMTDPPPGKVYQLWFNTHGTMRPAGLMDPTRSDQSVLMDGLDDATGMGITLEPTGGSPQPTTTPLTQMNLPT